MTDKDKARLEAACNKLGIKASVVDYTSTEDHQVANIASMENTGPAKREAAIAELERRAKNS
jgi:hypothetical protein